MTRSRGKASKSKAAGVEISQLMDAERYVDVEEVLRRELRRKPADHWLWERLSAALHEQRRSEALAAADKALSLEPSCSLAIWDKAGALDMLGEFQRAMETYTQLTFLGVAGLMAEMCNEGKTWTKTLIADAHYRLARVHRKLGDREAALAEIRKALALREEELPSLYSLGELRRFETTIHGDE